MPGNILTSSKSPRQNRIRSSTRRKLGQIHIPPSAIERLEARQLLTIDISHPYPGLELIYETETSPQAEHIHIAKIDLNTPGLGFETTPQSGTSDTMSQTTLGFLKARAGQLAINANFFTPVQPSSQPVDIIGFAASLTRANAQLGLPGTDFTLFQNGSGFNYAIVANSPALNIAANNTVSILHYDPDPNPAKHNHALEVNQGLVTLGNAVSGSAQIVDQQLVMGVLTPVITIPTYNGLANGGLDPNGTYSNANSWYNQVRARTAIGFTADNKLLLFTVDETGGSSGMTVGQVAQKLIDNGAIKAINLDGGGSTNMSMQDPNTGTRDRINQQSDQGPNQGGNDPGRLVANTLVFFAPAPVAPLSLAATGVNGSGNSTITWASGYTNTNYGDSDKITIERSTDNVNWTVVTSTALANALTYTATGLAQNTTYYFRAKVSNAAFASPSPYSSIAIALVINGTAGNDLQDVSWDGTYVTVHGVRLSPFAPAANVTSLLVNGGAGNDTIDLSLVNSGHGFNESVLFGRITVQGDAGDDLITGGPIGESLNGGDGSDTIDGGAGNDTIDGGAVYDRIHGGDGNDSIHGGTGDDALFGDRMAYGGAGSPGNDVIWGDEGNDDISGGHWAITSNDGNDQIYGGSGSDRFYEVGGNQGNDIITDDQQDVPTYIDWIIFSQWTSAITLHLDTPGSQQNLSGGGSITISTINSIENIWGGSGNDYLYGDGRANYLDGQAGNDHIYGGAGNDSLAGYDGYDYLYGEADNDLMWPEYGGGEMYGGTGNDTYDFVMTYGNNYFVYEDAIVGGSDGSSDTLDFTGAGGPVVLDLANSTTGQSFAGITLKLNDGMGIENVYCSQNTAFNWGDTLFGNARPNILKGGVGNDFIYGRGGADTLYGEDGNDYLDSGGSDGAADNISGGNGDDTLVNHDGPDVWDTIEHVL